MNPEGRSRLFSWGGYASAVIILALAVLSRVEGCVEKRVAQTGVDTAVHQKIDNITEELRERRVFVAAIPELQRDVTRLQGQVNDLVESQDGLSDSVRELSGSVKTLITLITEERKKTVLR